MRVDVLRLRAAAGACLFAASLLLAACARSSSAPAGGETPAQSRSLVTRTTPAQNTQPTTAPSSPVVESPLPRPEGFVADFAEVIDAETEEALEAKLRQLKERANIEMGIATIKTTGGREIAEYSLAVARGWGLGPPPGEEGGGLLLVLAVEDRVWQVQVTRSINGDIPDEVAAKIGNGMTDSLRARRYGEAVTKCVDGLIQRLAERRGFTMKASEPNVQTKNANRKP